MPKSQKLKKDLLDIVLKNDFLLLFQKYNKRKDFSITIAKKILRLAKFLISF